MGREEKYFDIQYINRFKEGDDSAFEVIYEYYKKHIYYMGMQFFKHDSERAKDLVQNTFSEVYINIKKLKSSEAFFVWMNQIAYRQGCNMLRYQSKDSTYYTIKVDEEYVEEQIADDSQKDILSEIQKKEAIDSILAGLNEMDEDKRLVGYLRYFEELSLKEISEVTGMPENTVGSHLHRIKAKLKKQLEQKGFTSATCFSLLLVPNLISYYDAFVILDKPMVTQTASDIRQVSKKKVDKKTANLWMNLSKVVLGFVIVIPTVSVMGTTLKEQQATVGKAAPVFTEVFFDQKVTNQNVKIHVKTSNDNYDGILINDTTDLHISNNGEYEVKLMKSGKAIDSRKITVANIDRDIPEVIHEQIENDAITFTIKDDLSGIDFDNIHFQIDGVESDRLQVDRSSHTIRIPFDTSTDSILKIADLANNILNIEINSFTTSAN